MTQLDPTPNSDIALFDRARIAQSRQRAMPHLDKHGFLFDWTDAQLLDRLIDVTKAFPTILQIGRRSKASFTQALKSRKGTEHVLTMDVLSPSPEQCESAIIAEDDVLPFAHQTLELIISALSFHSVNDLPGALIQMRQALKADGMFLAAMFGGETLYELRDCLTQAELELSGGVSPRVAPFADKQDMGALLQRAGFALPVVDSDIITVTYDHIFDLMRDVRMMGENNAIAARSRKIPPKNLFMRAAEIYASKYSDPQTPQRIVASFEIIFLIGWAPHESQQKPLRPGSAKTRLADILGTKEVPLQRE